MVANVLFKKHNVADSFGTRFENVLWAILPMLAKGLTKPESYVMRATINCEK